MALLLSIIYYLLSIIVKHVIITEILQRKTVKNLSLSLLF